MSASTRATVEDFEQFAALPENAARRFEFIGGEIAEVVSNNYSSLVAGNILFLIKLRLRERGQHGYVTGADGGYVVGNERYLPDVGYVSAARQAGPSLETYNPNAPDLAVEVLSPSDKAQDVRVKIVNYLAAGTTVWVVDPIEKTVEVYTPGPSVVRLTQEDTLPDFEIAVNAIFDV